MGDKNYLTQLPDRRVTSLYRHRSLALIAMFLAMAVACNSADPTNNDGSTSPAATQIVVTAEVTELEQVSDQGEFLRVIAPLDEARGYCLDIPGHMAGVQIESPLQVHTCKHGIWNQDGRFDVVALGNGVIRMPYYGLCLQAESTSIGARLLLTECNEAELQTWSLQGSGEIALEAFPQMCITVEEGPGRNAGGPQYLMKGVGLDTCARQSNDRQQWTTVMPQ